MAVKKLSYIKDIKYKGVHPLDKKKLIKKTNDYIDSYNEYQQMILNSLNNPNFSKHFENLIYEKLTKKINEKIQSATLKNGKSTLKEIDKKLDSILENASNNLIDSHSTSFKKIIGETNKYSKDFFLNVSETLKSLKADVYKKDLENLAYSITSKISEKEIEKCLSNCSEKDWNDISKNIEITFETTLKNSLEDLKSTIALINEKHLSKSKINGKITDYIRKKFDDVIDKETGREHLGGNVRSLYDEYINEIKTELKKIFEKISDDEIKSVRDLINLGLKNSDPSKSFKIVNSAIESAYETLNKNINSGEYGIKEFITNTVKPKIDEIINRAKQQN